MPVRLNKYLADRGVGARRKCDELIAEGRVSVNGRVVSEAGTKVEEGRDRVSVDGKFVGGKERHVYFVLNKPVGVITTLDDPQGRRTIREFLPRGARVYPVGRLDADTSGLLLLTNDGDLAHRLMHPRYGVAKVYRVRLAQEPRGDQLRRLGGGVRFDKEKDTVSGPARVRRIDPGFDAIMIEMTIHEGRFRQVRRMCEAVGLEVTGLHRVGYGPLRLGPMTRGMFRELSEEEVERLRAASARPVSGRERPGKPRPGAAARFRPESLRPAGPARASKAPPTQSAPPWREDEADEDVEETWLPGGGFLEPADEGSEEGEGGAPAWPARPSGRRGDADWRPDERPAQRRSHGQPESRAVRPAARESRPASRDSRPASRTSRPERDSRPASRTSRTTRTTRTAGPAAHTSRPERASQPSPRSDRSRGPGPERRGERGGRAATQPRGMGRSTRPGAERPLRGGPASRAERPARAQSQRQTRAAIARSERPWGERPFKSRPDRKTGGPRAPRGGGNAGGRAGGRQSGPMGDVAPRGAQRGRSRPASRPGREAPGRRGQTTAARSRPGARNPSRRKPR